MASSGDWRRQSKWWLPTSIVVIALMVARLVAGVHSLGDAGAIVMTLVLIACLAAAGHWAASRRVARRIAVLTAGRDGAHCWRVSEGTFNRYFLIDVETVSLVTGGRRVVRSWPRDQVRRVAVVKIRYGFPSRPGLQIDFGHHRAHERLELVFVRGLGLWCSRDDAIEAQQLLQTHPV